MNLVQHAKVPIPKYYRNLFKVLHILSGFWLEVKDKNLEKVRKSDIYIYKLSSLLLDKVKSQ